MGENDFDDVTPENLQQKLRQYQEALEQEYELANVAAGTDAAQEVAKNTREFLRKNVSVAAAQVVWIATNSTSDATRFAASKYIVDKVLEDDQATADPLTDLLKELSAKAPSA